MSRTKLSRTLLEVMMVLLLNTSKKPPMITITSSSVASAHAIPRKNMLNSDVSFHLNHLIKERPIGTSRFFSISIHNDIKLLVQ